MKNLLTTVNSAPGSCRSALIAFLLTVSLLTACAPVRTQVLDAPVSRAFADSLMQEWSASAARVTSLQGLAQVRVQAPLNSLHGSQVILAEKPDRLRAETLSPFGAPLLLLAADGGKLGVLLPAQNVYYTGAATPANLDLFVHMPLRLPDLVEILLYQPPLLDAWKEEAFTLQEGGWLLVRHGTLRRQELVFNPGRQLVEVSFFEQNDLVLKVNYGQFPVEGNRFPHLFRLELPASRATVTLEFADLQTNGTLRAGIFQLTPPPGARVVYLPDGAADIRQ